MAIRAASGLKFTLGGVCQDIRESNELRYGLNKYAWQNAIPGPFAYMIHVSVGSVPDIHAYIKARTSIFAFHAKRGGIKNKCIYQDTILQQWAR